MKSCFQARASGQPCISSQLWSSEPSPGWKSPSHTHHTQPQHSSYQSLRSQSHTRCPPPGRERQRHCPHRHSRCLLGT
uniref:ARNT-interacting protein 2 n=1 Tax=Homo sapiens TaxID=9606 RepID=Q3YB83_HUMAN|nr:ARNT-interacting protein 2 [Homo sapiens]